MSIIAPAEATWLPVSESLPDTAEMGVPFPGGNGSARKPVNLEDFHS
ncbi:MAG: hypothetical protein QOH97_5431 [Actinoplanes sp.]|jgi:hypothetical protein|nr:hypothetical protein [Actinoplanes sp.]